MVFGRCYDRALWLMLNGNKGEEIKRFLECIPEEFLKKIQKTLNYYQDYLLRDEDICSVNENFKLNDSVVTNGDMIYWYSLDIETRALDIGEGINDDEFVYDTFQIRLFPLKRKHYRNLESFDEHLLGDISYNFAEEIIDERQLYDFDYISYNLFRLPFGIMLVRSNCYSAYYKDGRVGKDKYHFVNVRDIPRDYDVLSLNNKHVRSRKKDKNSR